jgi:hypothetical protein
MPGIMGDHDIEGQFERLIELFKSPTWGTIWEKMGFTRESFASIGIATNSPDALVWWICQERQIVLVTANRNDDGPDSLEATIRQYNREDSLPVFTIGDPQEFSLNRSYAERAAEKLLDYLLELDKIRGTGRLYIP